MDIELDDPIPRSISTDDDPDAPERTPEEQREEDRKAKLHAKLLKWFAADAEHDKDQRAREEEDMKFARAIELTDQWPESVLKSRGAIRTGADDTTPERPCLMLNQLGQPTRQIVNEASRSRFALIIKAKGGGASKKQAETRQGIARAIEIDSGAMAVRMSAYQRCVIAGRGWYRLNKQYANDGDFDQDLVYEEIPDQGCVYIDCGSTKPDISDATRVWITDTLTKETYQERFSASSLAKFKEGDFAALDEHARQWVDEHSYQIAESYYLVTTERFLIVAPDGTEQTVKKLPQGYTGQWRQVKVRQWKYCLLNAAEILEETVWEGKGHPIMQLIGERYTINGKTAYKGIVRDARDPQRLFNYMSSAMAEFVGLTTRAPYLLDPKQIQGMETYWKTANTKNWPYLPYKAVVDGQVVGPPQRNIVEPPIQGLAQVVRESQANIQAVTGRHQASLGALDPNERSGIAIRELKSAGEIGSAHFLENFATITMPYDGKRLNEMLPVIYDRAGRNARLMGDDEGDETPILLNQPFVLNDQGEPMPAPDPNEMGPLRKFVNTVKGAAGAMVGAPPPPEPKLYELTKDGEYLVTCTVGQSFQTQRDENAKLIQSFIEAAPDMAPFLLDLLAEQLDGPIAARLAERIRALNPQIAAADAKTKGENPLPPEAQAQIDVLQQQLEQLQQQLAEAQQTIATDGVKAQAQAQLKLQEIEAEMGIKREELAMRFKVEAFKAQAALSLARANAASEEDIARLQIEADRLEQEADHAHDVVLEMLKASQARQTAVTNQHAAESADARKARMAAEADQRKGQIGQAADGRKAAMSAVSDSRKAEQAEEADRRAAARERAKAATAAVPTRVPTDVP